MREGNEHPPGGPDSPQKMLGECIRAWREHRGLRVTDVARALGVKSAVISKIEHGYHKHPPTRRIQQIATVLDVPAADFYRYKVPVFPDEPASQQESGPPLSPRLARQLALTILRATASMSDQLTADLTGLMRGVMRTSQQHQDEEAFRAILRQARQRRSLYDESGRGTSYTRRDFFGTEACMRAAIQLVESVPKVADTSAPAAEREILITWMGERSLIDVAEDTHLREDWVRAFREALTRGWTIKHLVHVGSSSRKALLLVLNILALLGHDGDYIPRLLSAGNPGDGEARDYVVVPPRGVLELKGLDHASFVPRAEAANLFALVRALDAGSSPVYERYAWDSIEFSNALTEAESHPGARYMLMDGLSETCVPPEIHDWRVDDLEMSGRVPANIPLARNLARNRRARWQRLRKNLKTSLHRDICPREAIERLVNDGVYSLDDTLLQLKCRPLHDPESLTVLETLVRRLHQHTRRYDLILLPEERADLCHTYYLAKEGYGAFLEYWQTTPGGKPVQVNIAIHDNAIARAFYQNPIWHPYRQRPAEERAADIAFLNGQIAVLRRRIARTRTR